MPTAREVLRERIAHLTEDQAAQLLPLVESAVAASQAEDAFAGLRGDPAFRLPAHGRPAFKPFEPIEGSGEPASRVLIADRR
jgi:hypothetical protein